jgi:hypothetical protein
LASVHYTSLDGTAGAGTAAKAVAASVMGTVRERMGFGTRKALVLQSGVHKG